MRLEQVMLHYVQHALELTEDQYSVLGHHSLCATVRGAAISQATVQQQLREEISHSSSTAIDNKYLLPQILPSGSVLWKEKVKFSCNLFTH